jgi:hypothetical protein
LKWSETEDAKEWDNFVSNNGGSIFHTWAWRSVLEGADVNPTYLVCREGNGTIRAVCPFFQTTGKRLRYLDSLPDSFMGGPIPKREESNPSEIIQSLVQSVRFNPFNTIAKVQIRAHRQEIVDSMIGLGFPYNTLYGLFIADLITRPPEHVWNNGFLKHDRQAVKYYGVAGSVFRLAESESDFAEYLGMKEGPTFHLYNQPNFFSKMRLSLGDNLKVGLVYFEEKVIAGVVLLSDPATSTVHLATMRYSTVKNIHSPVIYANWKVINWASEQDSDMSTLAFGSRNMS